MSNMGLEAALRESGIKMLRAPVGDKYVLEEMRKTGAVLGGEQSGHIILSREATTGDGLLTAIRVLGIVAASGQSAGGAGVWPESLSPDHQECARERKEPAGADPGSNAGHSSRRSSELKGNGRVNVRYSGTESLARVMVEAETEETVQRLPARLPQPWRPPLDWVVPSAHSNWCLTRKKRLIAWAVILALILAGRICVHPHAAFGSGAAGVGICRRRSVYRSGVSVCGGHAAAHVLCAGAFAYSVFLRPHLRAWHINRIRNATLYERCYSPEPAPWIAGM